MDRITIRHACGRATVPHIRKIITNLVYNSCIYGGIFHICSDMASEFEAHSRRQYNWFQTCIAYLNGKVVGTCIVDKRSIVHCYVKHLYRNRNIGKMLVLCMKRKTKRRIYGHKLTAAGEIFYTKLNLKIKT